MSGKKTKANTKINKKIIEKVQKEESGSRINNSDSDSSQISDVDSNQNIDIKEDKEDKEEDETKLMDYIIKYIKIDDMIKRKNTEFKQEVKPIKDSKKKLEDYIISYLDGIEQDFINVGKSNTLTKVVTEQKSAIKMDNIEETLIDGFKKHNLYEDDEEMYEVIKEFIKNIDEKRETKTKKSIVRTQPKEKKEAKQKAEKIIKSQIKKNNKNT